MCAASGRIVIAFSVLLVDVLDVGVSRMSLFAADALLVLVLLFSLESVDPCCRLSLHFPS